MAEIKIEKKKPWWPWILVLLIILAIAAYFLFYSDGELVDDDVSIESEEAIGNQVQEGFNATDVDSEHTKSNLEIAQYTSLIGDKSKLESVTHPNWVPMSNIRRMPWYNYPMPFGKRQWNMDRNRGPIGKGRQQCQGHTKRHKKRQQKEGDSLGLA